MRSARICPPFGGPHPADHRAVHCGTIGTVSGRCQADYATAPVWAGAGHLLGWARCSQASAPAGLGWYSRRKGQRLMKDLTVLTPPLLICAVVIIAIVAFLRHEMGRTGGDQSELADDISAAGPQADDEPDSAPGSDANASAPATSDS